MPHKDKEKHNEYSRNWQRRKYAASASVRRDRFERSKEWHGRKRPEFVAWWKEFKKTMRCAVCGVSESCCLDFHHVDSKTKNTQCFCFGRLFLQHGYDKGRIEEMCLCLQELSRQDSRENN
jgi:hypothetical protein